MFYGASVFDTATGKLLGDLLVKNVVSQRVLSRNSVLLVQQPVPGASPDAAALLEVKLDVGARTPAHAGGVALTGVRSVGV
jgi:hypothetical protein